MKRLVLLGAGHSHLHVLASLVRQSIAEADITLITPSERQIYSGMVPGLIAGHYAPEECAVSVLSLLAGGRVQWLQRSVSALDAKSQVCILDDGSSLGYDFLSVNTGPVHDRARLEASMPGSRENALFVRPIDAFVELWPRVCSLAEQRKLRIALIGGGAAGVELACAVAHRLPHCSVSLISAEPTTVNNYTPAVQHRVHRALRERRIDIIAQKVVRIESGRLQLSGGSYLQCDVPVIAIGAQAAPWLQGSGLALDDEGFIQVDAFQRSVSHANVYAGGDIAARIDRPSVRSGVYAVRAGPALSQNLRAALTGTPARAHQPPQKTLNLLSCGRRYAIGSWGELSFEGRWVWYLKDRIDRAFIARYKR